MKIYYAHPVSFYDKDIERADIAALQGLGFEVLNPNAREHEAEYAKRGMRHFEELVTTCQALAFRSFSDGAIPAGVAKEIAQAQALGLPVMELPNEDFLYDRILTVEETRRRLKGQAISGRNISAGNIS